MYNKGCFSYYIIVLYFLELSLLMTKYGLSTEQVDIKIASTSTHLIARHIVAHWELLAQNLGLRSSEIFAITGNDEIEKGKNMLKKWIQQSGSNATYSRLVIGCLKAREVQLADTICQELHHIEKRLQGKVILVL